MSKPAHPAHLVLGSPKVVTVVVAVVGLQISLDLGWWHIAPGRRFGAAPLVFPGCRLELAGVGGRGLRSITAGSAALRVRCLLNTRRPF